MFLWVRAATGFVYLSRCPTQLPARGAEHHHAVRKAQVKHFESRHGLLQAREKKHANGRPEVAVDCLLAQPIERLLTRKLSLKPDESAAIYPLCQDSCRLDLFNYFSIKAVRRLI
jgi:hypothetical protein